MDTDFQEIKAALPEIPVRVSPKEIVLPYEIRQQFRPKLMEFFELTNKRSGSYIWAEQQTILWFQQNRGISPSTWNYRK